MHNIVWVFFFFKFIYSSSVTTIIIKFNGCADVTGNSIVKIVLRGQQHYTSYRPNSNTLVIFHCTANKIKKITLALRSNNFKFYFFFKTRITCFPVVILKTQNEVAQCARSLFIYGDNLVYRLLAL